MFKQLEILGWYRSFSADLVYLYKNSIPFNICKNDKSKWVIEAVSKKRSDSYEFIPLSSQIDTSILHRFLADANLCIKVKDFKESSRIFAHRKTKEEMINIEYPMSKCSMLGYYEKESKGFKGYVCEIYNEKINRKVKFTFDDLEIVLPNLTGYNFPKDRTMKVNSTLVCKGGKNQRGYKGLSKGDKVLLIRVVKEYPKGKIQLAEVMDKNENRFVVKTRDFKVSV